MRIDPALKLALAIHENKGAYALLLGSGVSRAAEVPTGWEVTLDLVRKIARAEGAADPSDAEGWYRARYNATPDYSKLLSELAPTPAERRAILSSYFEPSAEDREQGLKVPTAAHNAVANLVRAGHVRVILTTNFDRLIETALESVGVTYDVVRTVHDLEGIAPYAHGAPLVVKLHGDYRDTRIRNTHRELGRYPKALDEFLDRIFDEFGLVVAGWSGSYDSALRDALARRRRRRFSVFWLTRSDPAQDANELMRALRAENVHIDSADAFFPQLLETLTSLEALDRPHPLSTESAVATVKRYLTDERHRISLHDLVMDEVEAVHGVVTTTDSLAGNSLGKDGFRARMARYQQSTDRLLNIAATIAFHGEGAASSLLTSAISRLCQFDERRGVGVLLQAYPALLVEYAAGVSALAAGRYGNLASVIRAPTYYDEYDRSKQPAIDILNVWNVFDQGTYKWVDRPNDREYTPANNHLLELLQPILSTCIPSAEDCERFFDLFEYFLSLTYVDLVKQTWLPPGRYWWKWKHRDSPPSADIVAEAMTQGATWPPLRAGFFAGTIQRFKEVVKIHDDFVTASNHWG